MVGRESARSCEKKYWARIFQARLWMPHRHYGTSFRTIRLSPDSAISYCLDTSL